MGLLPMNIDLNLITLLGRELNEELTGGRIEKIRQPGKDIILLTVKRRDKGPCTVLISASGGRARVHLTAEQYDNPAEPPMFCMLLRKHLTGSIIEEITQPGEDRVLCFNIKNTDELGRQGAEKLYIELMQRAPDIVLAGEDGIIIDCILRRDYDRDMYRRLYPGMIYRLPQKPEGFVAPEEPTMPDLGEAANLSEYLDGYFSKKEKDELIRRKSKELRTIIQNAVKRTERKLGAQREELEHTKTRDAIRREADLITANMYKIKRGDEAVIVQDYFDECCPEVEIKLDPLKSPSANAAAMYKQYNKLKTAEQYLSRLIGENEEKLEYYKSTLDELSRAASEKDIEEIRQEITSAGLIKGRRQNGQQKKVKKQPPISCRTSGGFEVLAGRNNTQNDELTFKLANRNDIWLHVKGYHGSHVILKTAFETPSGRDIYEAAQVAVANSEAAGSTNTAVDYCQVKYVKKPSGALPGRVVYTEYETILVRN